MKKVSGFSKLSKLEKIKWLEDSLGKENLITFLQDFWHHNPNTQKILDEFSENTIANFPLPFGIAPNFIINGNNYSIPMVIEESSVVAAASKAAKFWAERGGFKYKIHGTVKNGQIHLFWNGEDEAKFLSFFESIKGNLVEQTNSITSNMRNRGGGILGLELKSFTKELKNYYQIVVKFETCDAMGANFINSCLESIGKSFQSEVMSSAKFSDDEKDLEVNMCILSNYTPECLVEAYVECPISDLENVDPELSGKEFALKFKRAVDITHIDPYRATTHNKGIYNGIDSVVLATGNDFRAIEACGHAYASNDGKYKGLSNVTIENDIFRFSLKVPLAVGTVGGLTSLHPLAKLSLDILDRPNAKQLMGIIAVTGLAQNFAAVRSLTTTGIQKGHMKMHLLNILNHLEATEKQREIIKEQFNDKVVSFKAVRESLEALGHPNSESNLKS